MMNYFICFTATTANILGIFNDPFEFEGDYGPEVNPIRQKVFEQVVAKESLVKNLTDFEVKQFLKNDTSNELEFRLYKKILTTYSMEQDQEHGPLLSKVFTPDLIQDLTNKQRELEKSGFSYQDLEEIFHFVMKYGDQRIFRFLRNNPPEFLSIDKKLRDRAAREGKNLELPILSSTHKLNRQNAQDLKIELLSILFNDEMLQLTKPEADLKKTVQKLNENYLKGFFGNEADNQDLQAFTSPAGQVFFYWLYQALNFHLIADDENLIDGINKVKEIFSNTLGNAHARATAFREKLILADSAAVFTQEADQAVENVLTGDHLFLPVHKQNPKDGTFVFLRSDIWEPHYEVIPIEEYEGYAQGRLNLVLATLKETQQKFLLASGHGHSTRAEDGRQQIALIMKRFEALSKENTNLQLLIGIDANTKTPEDVNLLRAHLDRLGLTATDVGPTTIKKRMVTTQHAKAGKTAVDEEDYLITLKPENGAQFHLDHTTVGFSKDKPDVSQSLPNLNNPSDHYPVGATLTH